MSADVLKPVSGSQPTDYGAHKREGNKAANQEALQPRMGPGASNGAPKAMYVEGKRDEGWWVWNSGRGQTKSLSGRSLLHTAFRHIMALQFCHAGMLCETKFEQTMRNSSNVMLI